MRFSIFKTFSLLNIHRRSKSESSAADLVAPTLNTRTRSLSVANVDELALDLFGHIVPNTTAYPIYTTPTGIHTVLPTSVPAITTSATPLRRHIVSSPFVNTSSRRLAVSTQRIQTLEAEIAELKNANAVLTLDADIREEELAAFKSDYYAERSMANTRSRQAKADDEKIIVLERKLVQFERFTELMIDLGLHEPVLARTRCALLAGEEVDEALVDAIKEAAAKPGSPWSRIIPAVTGPRTSDEYLSAIEMTLKTRRSLKESQKVAKFWKKTAQEDDAHANTITPSSSALSSINEVLTEERQTAVDDLLAKLRSGKTSNGRPPVAPKPRDGLPTSLEAITPSTHQTHVPPTPETIPSPSELTPTARDSTCTILPHASALAPLASQTFKEELIASHSSKRFSMTKQARPVLGNVDINRQHKNAWPITSSNSVSSNRSKLSAKALGKRKAMVVTESIESISASFRSVSIHIPDHPAPIEPVLPTQDSFAKTLSVSLGAINERSNRNEGNMAQDQITDGSAPFYNSTFVDNITNSSTKSSVADSANESASQVAISEDPLSTDHALLSLERICAGFESGNSLGSLGTISEESESDGTQDNTLTDTCVVPDLASNDIQGTKVSLVTEPTVEVSFPVKHSRLPVFKRLRKLSISVSPKKTANSPPIRSARQPSVSSAMKVTTATTKGHPTLNENANTPPLLLTKRTKKVICSPTTPSATRSRVSRIPALSPPRTPATMSGSGMVSKGKRAARTLSRIIS